MNTSQSPTLSNADPMHALTDSSGSRSGRPAREGASDSFTELYHSETASFERDRALKDSNINSLDGHNGKERSARPMERNAADDSESPFGKVDQEDTPGIHRPLVASNMDEIPDSAEQGLASEDAVFDTELLHGIGIALPSYASREMAGEKFPPGGKALPHDRQLAEQELALTKLNVEAELGEIAADAETEIPLGERKENSEVGSHNRQARLTDPTSIRMEHLSNEPAFGFTQSRASAESAGEGQAQLTSKPLPDTTNVAGTGSTSAANQTSAVSQSDAVAAQKLNLITGAGENSDPLNSVRGNSLDRSSALGERIHWMWNAKISTAELQLHPAELGSIEIKIITEDQQARVSFVTASATARDVIEESLPKLRDLLSDSGLALEQSDISQKESGDEHTPSDSQTRADSPHLDHEEERTFTASTPSPRLGQVDHYV